MTYKIKKLPLNEMTADGSYWAKVNGQKVGANGRAFWNTRSEAIACARRYILATENTGKQNDQ